MLCLTRPHDINRWMLMRALLVQKSWRKERSWNSYWRLKMALHPWERLPCVRSQTKLVSLEQVHCSTRSYLFLCLLHLKIRWRKIWTNFWFCSFDAQCEMEFIFIWWSQAVLCKHLYFRHSLFDLETVWCEFFWLITLVTYQDQRKNWSVLKPF